MTSRSGAGVSSAQSVACRSASIAKLSSPLRIPRGTLLGSRAVKGVSSVETSRPPITGPIARLPTFGGGVERLVFFAEAEAHLSGAEFGAAVEA